jgi:hypothetical protein
VEVKPNYFKKETKPQETQGLSFRGSEAKLFRKRNKTPRNARAKPEAKLFRKRNKILRIARAKPSRKQNQIVSKKKQNPKKCRGRSLRRSEAKLF